MKKNILIFLIGLMIFNPVFLIFTQTEAQAVVAGKVINTGAKKVAKEVVQEITWNMTQEMVINYKYTPKASEPKPKPGFELVCFPADKQANGLCGKTLEIKTNLTSADRQAMDSKIESVIEKKITGGTGLKKWQKFTDWLVPISTVLMGATLLDYAMDGDVASLFDEIAYDTLVEMGLVVAPEVDVGIPGIEYKISKGSSSFNVTASLIGGSSSDYIMKMTSDGYSWRGWTATVSFYQAMVQTEGGQKTPNPLNPSGESKSWNTVLDSIQSGSGGAQYFGSAGVTMQKVNYYTNEDATPPVPTPTTVPKFNETEIGSNFVPNQNVKIVNPTALPMTETGTGLQVVPQRQPDGTIIYKPVITDGTTGEKTLGEPIPEDNVEVGSPKKVVVTDPTGVPTGETIIENPNFDPVVNPPPVQEDTPPEEIPNSCSKLKKPNFKPLTNAFTTSFPFSIPWDLKRMFESAFSDIGNERPSFSYEFEFNGQQKKWDIEFPQYFDKWTSFTRGLLILIFDIGLIYAIYRFTKGGD